MRKVVDLSGQKFNRLTVLRRDPNRPRYWVCRCECGNIISTFGGNITQGLTKSCGCLNKELTSQRTIEDLTGKRFGNLTVIRRIPGSIKGKVKWECQCDCGNVVNIQGWDLKRRINNSCGCVKPKPKHYSVTNRHAPKWITEEEQLLSNVYQAMRQRCYDPHTKSYPRYGGRGIYICDEWLHDKRAFVDWALTHGFAKGLSIERIDNDGPYCPENCRWATKTEQANNRVTNRFVTVDGVKRTVADWARLLRVNYRFLWKLTDRQIVSLVRDTLTF